MFNLDNINAPTLQTLARSCNESGSALRGVGAWGAIYFFCWAGNPGAAMVCTLAAAIPANVLNFVIAPYFRDTLQNRMRTEEHAHDENVGRPHP